MGQPSGTTSQPLRSQPVRQGAEPARSPKHAAWAVPLAAPDPATDILRHALQHL